MTPLHYAAKKYGNNIPIVSLLIEKGANVHARERYAIIVIL